MSTNPVADLIANARLEFEESLIRAGFVEQRGHWSGTVSHGRSGTRVQLTLPSEFPFAPPRVKPAADDPVPWSWHRELDGALCLVAEDDHDDLWWSDAGRFLDHVQAWFESSDAGWIGDRPDLDLERYFRGSDDSRLYLYGNLDEYVNSFVRFRPAHNNVMRLAGRGTSPKKPRELPDRDVFGYVAALGDIATPPRGWADLAGRIQPSVDLERQIRERRVRVVLLTYTRGQHDGAILLQVWPNDDGGISARWLRSASDTPQVRAIRSGPRATELGEATVAIVGVGAIGSFVCDLLVRAGVHHLTLVDDDLITPGNLVRHLVGQDCIGLAKSTAVKRHLIQSYSLDASGVTAHQANLATAEAARTLLTDHDLTINATADFTATALLHATAAALGTQILSVALLGEGATYRIDMLPPLDGNPPLQPLPATPATSDDAEYFEPGCGSPISRTPPHAVVEAAAAAVRHAIGLLLRQPVHPAGEIRHLTPKGTATA